MRILCVCLGVSIILIILLSVYIVAHEPSCERIHLDDNLKLWETIDAVPDEDTARKIADIIIENLWSIHFANEPEYEFSVQISFDDDSYAWEVYYTPIPPEGYVIAGGGRTIHIRKDCGMITYIEFSK